MVDKEDITLIRILVFAAIASPIIVFIAWVMAKCGI